MTNLEALEALADEADAGLGLTPKCRSARDQLRRALEALENVDELLSAARHCIDANSYVFPGVSREDAEREAMRRLIAVSNRFLHPCAQAETHAARIAAAAAVKESR